MGSFSEIISEKFYIGGNRILYGIFLVLLFSPVGHSHPLCIDKTLPKTQASALLFCEDKSYSDYGCCDTAMDNSLKKTLEAMNINNDACKATMKAILCAQCDPYSAHLFGVEGNKSISSSALLHPYLCSTTSDSSDPYCRAVYKTCGAVPVTNSPYATNVSSPTEIDSTYSSATDFCYKNQNPSVPDSRTGTFCFGGSPFELPAASKVFPPGPGICFDKIASKAYIDFVPHPDGSARAFLTSKEGYVHLVDLPVGKTAAIIDETATPFLNISQLVLSEGEFGLNGLAFHPKFLTNGLFYVSYSCDSAADPINCKDFICPCDVTGSNCTKDFLEQYAADRGYGTGYCRNATVIAEYRVPSTSISTMTMANVTSSRVIFSYGQPFNSHIAGQIHFGPLDGFLYIQLGDGGAKGDPFNFAQNTNVLLGKILRIDVDNPPIGSNILYGKYGLPSTNPYFSEAGTGSARRGEIFATGFHNPRRCSFDRNRPSYFFCADSGEGSVEEVSLVSNGGNYGWRLYEGSLKFSASKNATNEISPVLEYTGRNNASSVGGFMSRSTIDACLFDRYVFADASGTFYAAEENPDDSGLFKYFKKLSPKCATGSPLECSTAQWESGNMKIGGWGEDNNAALYVLGSSGLFRLAEPSRCSSPCSQSLPAAYNLPPPPPSPPTSANLPSPSPVLAESFPPPPSEAGGPAPSPIPAPSVLVLSNDSDTFIKEEDRTLASWLIFAGVASLWIFIVIACCTMGYYRYNFNKYPQVRVSTIEEGEEVALEYERKLRSMSSSETDKEDNISFNSRRARRAPSRPTSPPEET